jgi:hypothetical protein
VLVACAPRMTHRVSKWVSNRARENWRGKWADKLFAASLPVLQGSAGQVTSLLACGPLAEVVDQLRQELGTSPRSLTCAVPSWNPRSLLRMPRRSCRWARASCRPDGPCPPCWRPWPPAWRVSGRSTDLTV